MEATKILFVDDDVNMLHTGEDLLISAGYEVSLAKSGKQAIDILNKVSGINLVLLDIDMPIMDGYETFAAIRETENGKNLPVIFLTGMDMPEYEIKGLEMGAADYVTKPFVKDVLLARVKRQMKKDSAPTSEFDEKRLKELETKLTASEFSVAKLVAKGYSNQEIAEKLCYSYGYVKKMVSIILEKLYFTKRTELRSYLKNE